MSIQINKEDFVKSWQPGIYPKSTSVIYNNELYVLNENIVGLFKSVDFETELINGDWINENIKLLKINDLQDVNTSLEKTTPIVGDKLFLKDNVDGVYKHVDYSNLNNTKIFTYTNPNNDVVYNNIIGAVPTIMHTENIGTLKDGSLLRIYSEVKKQGVSNFIYLFIYINNSPTLTGATLIQTLRTSTTTTRLGFNSLSLFGINKNELKLLGTTNISSGIFLNTAGGNTVINNRTVNYTDNMYLIFALRFDQTSGTDIGQINMIKTEVL